MKNKYSEIIKKAKKINQRNERIRMSYDYIRVIGLLSGLGFLVSSDVKPAATSKVDIATVINIGLRIEPRVIEVLPAAVLSFPKSFLHLEKMPQELKTVISALKKGETGPGFENISFDKFLEAVRRPIKNKKRKLLEEKRIAKTFRFSPLAIQELKAKAVKSNKTYTAYLENLIFQA